MSEEKTVTACLILIGNEILSGRTQDKNLAFIAKGLNELGVQMREVRVIPDIRKTIVDTLNECRAAFDYIFTTGGIGPTSRTIPQLYFNLRLGLSDWESQTSMPASFSPSMEPELAQ